MENNNKVKHIAIVGGGLVGALNACFLAKRGFKVDVYELRSDIRTQKIVKGKSINLALSCRGREALREVGLEDHVVSNGTPMYARMIHNLDWSRHPIPYGKKDQYIMSVDRRKLNELLLTAAEKYPNVKVHFEHKLISMNCKTGELLFEKPNGGQVEEKVDLIVGNDGAFSAVRKQLMKHARVNYSQEYIPHGYMELCILPKDGKFNMETNYLHIWPRKEFMMIGLPNGEDKTFVVTLFMPFEIFEKIKTERQLVDFFQTKFPDSIPLIGEESLISTFFNSKPLPMVSVKCSPYHYEDKVVIMGDAAHAMVPFYGQGMNCGFEDCIIFNQLLDKHNNNFRATLEEYTKFRQPDNHAICDLAMYNYVEMRDLVNSRLFLLRKKLDNFLYWMLPNTWVPLYTMVSFTRIRYHEAIERRRWQDKMLSRVINVIGFGFAAAGTLLATKYVKAGHADQFIDLITQNARILVEKF